MARTEPFDKYLGEYEKWFAESRCVHESEIEAVRHFVPAGKKGIEIGIGTGRFAVLFHIQEGVEPSGSMRDYSTQLGLNVIEGTAQKLPLEDESDDFALRRVLKPGGSFIVGLVDKDSPLGPIYAHEGPEHILQVCNVLFGTGSQDII